MPAAFAHDLFGRLVYRKLDPGIRRAVRGLKTVADYLELEFYKTVPFGVRMVTELYRALEEGTELPREYKGNFEGSVFGKGPVRW